MERLLLIEEWDVWPSGEHFPLFTRLREACGERRSLIDTPGHLFGLGDAKDGLSFLILRPQTVPKKGRSRQTLFRGIS